ncbi:MAG: isoprenylcysteine carboxylmethyltransferase family protein [Desulfoferrobacter sp.]
MVNTVLSVVGFIVPGIDHRFNLSHVPINIVLLADIMIMLGYLLIFRVFQENIYASSIVEVEKDQRVVTTGLYSFIRHPMYMGAMIMLLFVPLALGSYWALIPFLLMNVLVVIRLLNEEKFLLKELPGYREYAQKTPYRLIPYVW